MIESSTWLNRKTGQTVGGSRYQGDLPKKSGRKGEPAGSTKDQNPGPAAKRKSRELHNEGPDETCYGFLRPLNPTHSGTWFKRHGN
jgi:hypothetical protein